MVLVGDAPDRDAPARATVAPAVVAAHVHAALAEPAPRHVRTAAHPAEDAGEPEETPAGPAGLRAGGRRARSPISQRSGDGRRAETAPASLPPAADAGAAVPVSVAIRREAARQAEPPRLVVERLPLLATAHAPASRSPAPAASVWLLVSKGRSPGVADGREPAAARQSVHAVPHHESARRSTRTAAAPAVDTVVGLGAELHCGPSRPEVRLAALAVKVREKALHERRSLIVLLFLSQSVSDDDGGHVARPGPVRGVQLAGQATRGAGAGRAAAIVARSGQPDAPFALLRQRTRPAEPGPVPVAAVALGDERLERRPLERLPAQRPPQRAEVALRPAHLERRAAPQKVRRSTLFEDDSLILFCVETSSRYSPSPPQHPPPQPPARRSSSSGGAGSASVPASPVLQPRHLNENVHSFNYGLPRHLTPEPQRRTFSQRFEL